LSNIVAHIHCDYWWDFQIYSVVQAQSNKGECW
jgi:hypothetical protein